MDYQFKLNVFEGPLDLLLHLIKEEKMDVNDIPVAEITLQYLKYLDLMQDLNLELAGDYLVMAAELTRIKSRMLLPQADDEESPEEGEDPRADLIRRLLEYQRYKGAASELRNMEQDRQLLFSRIGEVVLENDDEGEETLGEVTVFDLLTAFKGVLEKKSFTDDYDMEITTLSVTDRIKQILDVLNKSESVTFESLFTELNKKIEVIVTFLGLLELMRLQLVRIQQIGHYEAIRIYKTSDAETQAEILKDYTEDHLAAPETE